MLFREIQCCHAFMKVLEEKMEELPLSHKASNDTNVPGRISKYCTSNCLCVFLFVLKSRVIHRGCQCSVKQCLKHLNDSGHLRSFLLGFHALLSHRWQPSEELQHHHSQAVDVHLSSDLTSHCVW